MQNTRMYENTRTNANHKDRSKKNNVFRQGQILNARNDVKRMDRCKVQE